MNDLWAIFILCLWFFGLLGVCVYDIFYTPLTEEEIESLGLRGLV